MLGFELLFAALCLNWKVHTKLGILESYYFFYQLLIFSDTLKEFTYLCIQSNSTMTDGLSLSLHSCAWAEISSIFCLLLQLSVDGCVCLCVFATSLLPDGRRDHSCKPFACPAHLHMLSLGCTSVSTEWF